MAGFYLVIAKITHRKTLKDAPLKAGASLLLDFQSKIKPPIDKNSFYQ